MTDRYRVYVLRDVRGSGLGHPWGLDPLIDAPDVDVTFVPDRVDDTIAPSHLAGADAVVSFSDAITAASLDGVEDLEIVARMGAGYENLDLDALTRHGIVAVHAPQGPTESVAQAALGMLIVCAHNLKRYDSLIRESGFDERMAHLGFELGDRTIGLVGVGLTGGRLVELLEPFDTDIQVYDPYVSDDHLAALGVRRVDELDTLLATSDLISLHVPLTDETRGMLGEAEFKRMPTSAALVNTTRGGIYRDADLARALREGLIAGAAIDVFENEPDIEGNPLLELDNCLVTPHIAGVTLDSTERIGNLVAESILAVKDGELPKNILNPDVYDEPIPADHRSPSYQ